MSRRLRKNKKNLFQSLKSQEWDDGISLERVTQATCYYYHTLYLASTGESTGHFCKPHGFLFKIKNSSTVSTAAHTVSTYHRQVSSYVLALATLVPPEVNLDSSWYTAQQGQIQVLWYRSTETINKAGEMQPTVWDLAAPSLQQLCPCKGRAHCQWEQPGELQGGHSGRKDSSPLLLSQDSNPALSHPLCWKTEQSHRRLSLEFFKKLI